MVAGNASPCAIGGPSLRPWTYAAALAASVAGARTAASVGTNSPVVRLLATKYAFATRCTSASVTLPTASRYANSVRQSPSAIHCAEPEREAAAVGELEVEVLQRRRAPALERLAVDRRGAEALDLRGHRALDLVDVRRVADVGGERDERRVVHRLRAAADRRRDLALDDLLVQPARRLAREDVRRRRDRRVVRRRTADRVVGDLDDVAVAGARERDAPLAVLDRLDGVRVRERARGPRQRAERVLDRGERRRPRRCLPPTISVALSGW